MGRNVFARCLFLISAHDVLLLLIIFPTKTVLFEASLSIQSCYYGGLILYCVKVGSRRRAIRYCLKRLVLFEFGIVQSLMEMLFRMGLSVV